MGSKNPRSLMLRSGELAGWVSVILSSPAVTSIASMIPLLVCVFALSRCTKMMCPSGLGMGALIALMTSSIMSPFYLSLPTVAGTNTLMPLGQCFLECWATLVSTIGQ
ncbi:unnamed protein product, partial [Choristocarpus tenellus]